jgi:hypothetical protein
MITAVFPNWVDGYVMEPSEWKMKVLSVGVPVSESVTDIVTWSPPDTGVTDKTLSVTVLVSPSSATALYTQVSPTAIGNGTESVDAVDAEVLLLELLPDAGVLDLLVLGLFVFELPEVLLGDDPPQAARTSPVAATSAAAAPARVRAEEADMFMFLTSFAG